MEIDIWANNLLKDVCEKWKSLEGKYDFWKCGFGIFYSPVYANPDLMVIGYNLGGDENSFNEEKALQLPTEHEYFMEDYLIARKMKKLFNNIGKMNLLEKSIKFNIIFFRSINDIQWNSINKEIRENIEKFCFVKVKEIIRKLKPKNIVTEGIKTYKILTQTVLDNCYDTECKTGIRGRRIYCKSKYGNTKVIGLIHPSGSRISNNEWAQIAGYLKEDL